MFYLILRKESNENSLFCLSMMQLSHTSSRIVKLLSIFMQHVIWLHRCNTKGNTQFNQRTCYLMIRQPRWLYQIVSMMWIHLHRLGQIEYYFTAIGEQFWIFRSFIDFDKVFVLNIFSKTSEGIDQVENFLLSRSSKKNQLEEGGNLAFFCSAIKLSPSTI